MGIAIDSYKYEMDIAINGYEYQRDAIRASLTRQNITFTETRWGFELHSSAPIRMAVWLDLQSVPEPESKLSELPADNRLDGLIHSC